MNRVFLTGNLGAAPELKNQNGRWLLSMRLATNDSWKGASGRREERTDWHRLSLWSPSKAGGDSRAEALAKILKSGMAITVEGSLRTYEWEDRGAKRSGVEVLVRELEIQRGQPRPAQEQEYEGGEGGDHEGEP